MKCPRCGGKMVIKETRSSGRPVTMKVQCSECGFSEVQNDEGKKLLTEVQPVQDGTGLLTEG